MAMAAALVGCETGADGAKPGASASDGVVAQAAKAGPPWMQLVDDAEDTEDGKKVVLEVLKNDTLAPAGTPAAPFLGAVEASEYTLTLHTKPRHGSASIKGTRVTYTPTSTYVGEDDFMYEVQVKEMKGKPVGAKPVKGTAVVRITMNTPGPATSAKKSRGTTDAAGAPKKTKSSTAESTGTGTGTGFTYKNCAAVRAAGAAPIRKGQPGFGAHLDRDGDGVACER
ncbi:excalibur calcium-binding domain-containing protein [Streptomyces sp. NPDC087440]|uniref:excalibur calcium-binding domain-containing protein n=1 Tax=Streptomyces sp. NPDC087440 TaxID=3365790 RepID=UPI00381295D9